jgi:hypothetical protein
LQRTSLGELAQFQTCPGVTLNADTTVAVTKF